MSRVFSIAVLAALVHALGLSTGAGARSRDRAVLPR